MITPLPSPLHAVAVPLHPTADQGRRLAELVRAAENVQLVVQERAGTSAFTLLERLRLRPSLAGALSVPEAVAVVLERESGLPEGGVTELLQDLLARAERLSDPRLPLPVWPVLTASGLFTPLSPTQARIVGLSSPIDISCDPQVEELLRRELAGKKPVLLQRTARSALTREHARGGQTTWRIDLYLRRL